MKAIVLSAGQGRRLLPLTADRPKCLLQVDGRRSVLELQLATLARCGVERATVVTGFEARRVESLLRAKPIPGLQVELLYNPFYASSDNLATCWLARDHMLEDFVLLNGDTLFEDGVLLRLLDRVSGSIAVTVDQKRAYDADDMKVCIDPDGTLRAIGKTLEPARVNGESIGLLGFSGSGPKVFREALETCIREPGSLQAWYLSVVHRIAQQTAVSTVSARGLWWREIDSPEDLEEVRRSFPRGAEVGETPRAAVAG